MNDMQNGSRKMLFLLSFCGGAEAVLPLPFCGGAGSCFYLLPFCNGAPVRKLPCLFNRVCA